ncbi:hypothetical protein B5X24_HaOG203586 [Helicoverpa armigera]|uniref:Uncharacterized protein n=1 Tax=Helicoverpa armigera TaxID=29058 RepID=A0A2W1BQB5_HELAM|nr:hypothetical protein B5X24_HaOG203586 [Helicoverpa armigera]
MKTSNKTFIRPLSSVAAPAQARSRGRSIARREVIPQVRPPTPPPCLLLISGHRGGTFELALFVLAANTPPSPGGRGCARGRSRRPRSSGMLRES